MSKYETEVEPGHPNMSQSVILDLVGPHKRVLDVGCGGGGLARGLARQGCVVSGVEMDPEAAQEAKATLEHLVIGDLEGLDLVEAFEAESFDVVVFGDVLEHLTRPEDILRQARELLRPRGALVVSIPNVAHGDLRLSLLRGEWDYRDRGLLDDTHLRFFTRRGVDRLMAAAGFCVSDLRRVRLALFTTEFGLRREDFAPEIVALVEDSAESTTYQFVFRAYADTLDADLAQLRARVDEQDEQIVDLERQRQRLKAQLEASAAASQASEERRLAATHEVETLLGTRLFRWTEGARGAYSIVRGLRR